MSQTVSGGSLFSDELANLAFVVSNPRVPDNVIVFASQNFFKMTGYGPNEILGKNCRLLQGEQVFLRLPTSCRLMVTNVYSPISTGPGTSTQAVMEIRDAIREERDASVCLLNYRKDKTPFWNAFYISPVRGAGECVDYYIGIQVDVTSLMSGSGINDEAAMQAVAADELEHARRIADDVQTHAVELMQRCKSTCAVHNSIPSSLIIGLNGIQSTFVLSDPSLPDCPMVYCSESFLRMTGYSSGELCGRNCRILQGPETDPAAVQQIRDALGADPPRPVTVTLINYRKNGTQFWNCVHIAPIRDASGQVHFFCGVQLELPTRHHGTAATGEGVTLSCENSDEEAGERASVRPLATEATPVQLLQQKGIIGAVRVAARSLSTHGLRRAATDQHPPSVS